MEYVDKGAKFSTCERYRYRLWRQWQPQISQPLQGERVTRESSLPHVCVFVGLNPSTADGERDDPTIRRCVGFAKALGCDRVEIVNLFAFRATKPQTMQAAREPVGAQNNAAIEAVCKKANYCIAAWGVRGGFEGRDRVVCQMLSGLRIPLYCLGLTKGGFPKHPLYLPKSTPIRPWL